MRPEGHVRTRHVDRSRRARCAAASRIRWRTPASSGLDGAGGSAPRTARRLSATAWRFLGPVRPSAAIATSTATLVPLPARWRTMGTVCPRRPPLVGTPPRSTLRPRRRVPTLRSRPRPRLPSPRGDRATRSPHLAGPAERSRRPPRDRARHRPPPAARRAWLPSSTMPASARSRRRRWNPAHVDFGSASTPPGQRRERHLRSPRRLARSLGHQPRDIATVRVLAGDTVEPWRVSCRSRSKPARPVRSGGSKHVGAHSCLRIRGGRAATLCFSGSATRPGSEYEDAPPPCGENDAAYDT